MYTKSYSSNRFIKPRKTGVYFDVIDEGEWELEFSSRPKLTNKNSPEWAKIIEMYLPKITIQSRLMTYSNLEKTEDYRYKGFYDAQENKVYYYGAGQKVEGSLRVEPIGSPLEDREYRICMICNQ